MTSSRTSILAGLLSLQCVAGCSSSYRPLNSPRIAVAMEGGEPVLYKNGRAYPAGAAFGGVEEAVQGNPRAESEARTAHGLMVGSWVCMGTAIGGLVSGVALPPVPPTQEPEQAPPSNAGPTEPPPTTEASPGASVPE